jgi:hypothetical protein
MPVVNEQYGSDYKLHPVFDMNLPEGALGERLRKEFSKTLPNFDRLRGKPRRSGRGQERGRQSRPCP